MAGFIYPEIDSARKISDFPYLFETHLKSNIGLWNVNLILLDQESLKCFLLNLILGVPSVL